LKWVAITLLGGSVVLLLVAGGLMYAAARRRRPARLVIQMNRGAPGRHDRFAEQGFLLIVTWLAVKLGVDEAVLAESLNRR
jgi:hypothetical protein